MTQRAQSRAPLGAAGLVTAAVTLPAAAVVLRALGAGGSTASDLFSTRVLPLVATTVGLAVGASLLAVAIGLAGATLVVRRSFPGRALAVALLASPLALPPYLVAHLWLETTGPGSPLHGQLLASIAVIGLSTSPLCFLVLRAAMGRLDRTHEDAAATLGLSPRQRYWHLVVPSLKPAWLAGLCLVSLYACADFGAVSALGTRTFTREIFFQMDLNLNRQAAREATSVLSLVLLALAVPIFAVQRRSRTARYDTVRGSRRPVRPVPLSPAGQVGAWAFVVAVVGPTTFLVLGRVLALIGASEEPRVWARAFEALLNSALWAAAAATLAVLGALVVAWTASRVRGRTSDALVPLASLGFVLPGPVVALGALIVVTGIAPLKATVYGTAFVLIGAWVVRFLPEALQAVSAGLEQAPRQLEEAAQTLGANRVRAVIRVTLPIVVGSLATAWVFVFSASLRELPAALLLKPLGARTLSSEIWSFAKDSFYADMAPSALLLILFGIPAVALLVRRH
ncbi:MAG: iron ABC transporter permease [Proteobacteria bacterium]|nr:iron ABC transporter permease [Pseudomonadota bacterium]